MNPAIVIFRSELLPASETFIAAQAHALRRYTPVFTGLRRIPTGFELDPEELRAHPLRIGLSVTSTVDIHDTSGSLVAREVRQVPIPSQQSLASDPTVDARINQIIQSNLGSPKAQSRVAANWERAGHR